MTIQNITREEWLAIRRQSIGASEAAAACGFSPHLSELELFARKVGMMPDQDLSDVEHVRWGNLLEPAIVAETCARLKLRPLDLAEASIGPYQIQRAYWSDSRQKAGRYEDCLRDAKYSEQVMLGYWKRYCPDALRSENWEVLARVHNGGPKGAKKKATAKYWERVKKELARP